MFYFLRQDLSKVQNIIELVGHTPVTGQFQWTSGIKFDRPVPLQTLLLDPAYGTDLPDYFDTTIPVMSSALIQALRDAGVTNLDTYPMKLKRNDTGEEFSDYQAVNIIGCMDCVDLSQSEHRLRFGKPYFTGRIVIDPARIMGQKAFRLLKGPGFVVVDDATAARILERKLRAVLLQPTTDYAGT